MYLESEVSDMNALEELEYKLEHFNLKKAMDKFGLKTPPEAKEFLNKLVLIGYLSEDYLFVSESGQLFYSETYYNQGGVSREIEVNYWDALIWDDSGIKFKPEHGPKKDLKSNEELMVMSEYLKEKMK